MMVAPSPGLTRLDTILALVREQEEHRREQDLRLQELTQRLAQWEARTAEELAPLWALKERDVPRELDMARAAVESLVRQVATLNRTQQAAAAEASRAAARQQQWQDEMGVTLAGVRAEIGGLQSAVADVRSGTDEALESTRRWVEQQLAAHRDAVEAAVQVGLGTAIVVVGWCGFWRLGGPDMKTGLTRPPAVVPHTPVCRP